MFIQAARKKNRVLWVAVPLIIVWLLSTVWAFWWFQYRHVRLFDPVYANHNSLYEPGQYRQRLQQALAREHLENKSRFATLIHFWDPACPCARFNNEHVADLIAQYRMSGLDVVVVTPSGTEVDMATIHKYFGNKVKRLPMAALPPATLPPASPAVLVVDSNDTVAYYGPYSAGAFCSSTGGAFVEKVLDLLKNGKNPQLVNTAVSGCFCKWPKGQKI